MLNEDELKDAVVTSELRVRVQSFARRLFRSFQLRYMAFWVRGNAQT